MRRYLARAVLKEVRAAPALQALAVGGVALGVAAVLSIQLLNGSALGAFDGTVRAVSGDADLSVLGVAGHLPEELLPEVLETPGVASAVPLYRVEVALDGRAGALEVVGVDLLAPLRLPWSQPQGALAEALGTPGWVAVTPALAAEQGWRVGDAVAVTSGSRRATLRIGALVDFQRLAPLASRRLAVMDLAQVQGLLGAPGRLHQVDVRAAPGGDVAALSARLSARLGDRARVSSPEQRTVEAAGLLAAFRLNLTALSLVSLLVGGFLVHASARASLVRRREELGILRTLGATRGQVVRLVLGEAALLGLCGTAAGIPLGWLAARGSVGAVSGTLRTVYLLEGIDEVRLGPALVGLALATGLGGALLGALLPALDASRKDPKALLAPITLSAEGERRAPRLALLGLALLVAAAALHLAIGAWWRPSGFALAFGILAAAPLAAPLALRHLSRLARPRRLGVRHGLRTLSARLPATALAAGALAVAVAMLAGVTVMVGSFRETVAGWLDQTLLADVYVTSPSWRRARAEATLDPALVARLAAWPGVRAVDRLRQVEGLAAGRPVSIAGLDAAVAGAEGRVLLAGGDARAAFEALRTQGAVLVSEPLARRAGLVAGAEVTVRTLAGDRRFPVAGVYRDYGNERGALLMDERPFARAFGEGPPSNVALYLAPGADVEQVVADLRRAFEGTPLLLRSNRTLRAEVLAIFEETFAVTRLLQVMGLVIAVAGVALSLLVLARERSAELALYRALGATRGQVFRVFLGRGLGVAVFGLALGLVAGAGLAGVLVHLVNPAYFGWSLSLSWPVGALAAQAATILAAAALASLAPAALAARVRATELSRDAL
ncbi:MAG: FtsX-like permease family protein [Anaeromyxobacter sp.]|nr:FtsX-like permease family protein [Anaeromyxobacter sp.]